ncbi:MAG: hypothetical protein Q8N63_05305 [Nanoarchaeota archaeon]|nr:hypothetical protein [Nanoarchaeota archaeon]
MDTQKGLQEKLHPIEVESAKRLWRLLNSGPNFLSTREERREFLRLYAPCEEVMDYVRGMPQLLRESNRAYQCN